MTNPTESRAGQTTGPSNPTTASTSRRGDEPDSSGRTGTEAFGATEPPVSVSSEPPAAATESGTVESTPAPSAPSPESLLEAAKERRQKTKAEMERLRRQEEIDAAEEAALQRVVADIAQSVNAMALTMDTAKQEQDAIARFVDVELPQVADAVRGRVGEIDLVIKRVDDAVEEKRAAVAALHDRLQTESAAAQRSGDAKKAAEADFDREKGQQKRLQERLAELKKLRTRAADETRPVVKYVLGVELKRLWTETRPWIRTREEIQDRLRASYAVYSAALAHATADEEQRKRTHQQLDAARRDLEGIERLRLDHLLPQLSDLANWHPAPAPAAEREVAKR